MNLSLFSIWSLLGCNDGNPPPSMLPPVLIHGRLKDYTSTDCEFDIKIDLIQTGIDEPIYLTEVDEQGQFELQVPKRPTNLPLHVYGFCYSSTTDLDANAPSWSTEPYLLLSTHDPNIPIELIKATMTRSAPAVTSSVVLDQFSTEYNVWSQNPLLIEYYGLRHPKQEVSSSGSLPEIRQGGLSTKTQLTYIWALVSYLKSNSEPFLQELLLPSQDELLNLTTDLAPTSIKLQIIHGVLQNACVALNVHCPALNNLRQQEWILKDKSGVSSPAITQIRAELWFKGHHCIQQLLKTQQEIPKTIPMPSDLLNINAPEDAVMIHDRWDAFYTKYNLKPFSLKPSQ